MSPNLATRHVRETWAGRDALNHVTCLSHHGTRANGMIGRAGWGNVEWKDLFVVRKKEDLNWLLFLVFFFERVISGKIKLSSREYMVLILWKIRSFIFSGPFSPEPWRQGYLLLNELKVLDIQNLSACLSVLCITWIQCYALKKRGPIW